MTEATISSVEPQLVLPLFGAKDQHLRRLREKFNVTITHRNGQVKITGDKKEQVAQATDAIEQLTEIVRTKGNFSPAVFDETIARVTGESAPRKAIEAIQTLQVGKEIRPRTPGQATYVDSMRNNDLVFAVGPAGSGKTYLAVAMAVEALKNQKVRKLVLVRPAVEAGESLGFLPGDLQAKINPYLRPLLDAIHEMIGYDQVQQLIQSDVIEVCPLAYMRGRTLNESFIILDEAQNTTTAQMKMFLTRMGNASKIVVSGDQTQIDLPPKTQSGLADALQRLKQIKGVGISHLTSKDIVRHRLVTDIVQAYDGKPNQSRSS
ncbi:PhoH family protein [Mariniblastus sp.]|nr:PhoH family protein [Mariniblastus sp.]MDB2526725.1 PhoH family protein [Mariniblastus sp.]MDC0266020.1 PhoH family protein [Mariniblastus sp.]MDC0284369.1 PhoH family protein [Mariniblastus sp.]